MDFLAKFKKICAGIDNPVPDIVPVARYDEPVKEKPVRLYDVWKISLPPGINKIVLIGVTEKEAKWWIENELKARTYEDDDQNTKTLIFYEMFPQDATPREQNIYSNPERFCTEDFPAFNNPRRIN